MRLTASVLLLALALWTPSAQAGLWSLCTETWERIASPARWSGTDDIRLTAHQKQYLIDWANRFSVPDHSVHLLENQALLAFSELPPAIRRELFTRNDKPLNLRQVNRRADALGVSPFHPALRPVIDLYQRYAGARGQEPFQRLEAEVLRAITLPQETQAAIRGETRRRLLIGQIVAALKSSARFSIRFEGDHVVFPDGQRNRLVKRLSDGTLLVEFDYHDMLRTQDYFNGRIFAEYVRSKEGDGVGFDGSVTPDGRLMILDGHHRTAAYAHRHDGKVLGRIYPDADGQYRTLTHLDVLGFYQPHWSFGHWFDMSEAELKKNLEAVKAAPNAYLKDTYYRTFRGRRLDSLICPRPSTGVEAALETLVREPPPPPRLSPPVGERG